MISEENLVNIIDLISYPFPKLSMDNKYNKLYRLIAFTLLLDVMINFFLSLIDTTVVDTNLAFSRAKFQISRIYGSYYYLTTNNFFVTKIWNHLKHPFCIENTPKTVFLLTYNFTYFLLISPD